MNKPFLFHIDFNKESHQLTRYYIDSNFITQTQTCVFFKPIFLKLEDFNSLYENQDISKLFSINYKQTYTSLFKEEILKITPLSIEAKEQLYELIKLYSLQTFEFDISEIDYYLIESNENIESSLDVSKCRVISLDIETIGEVDKQRVNLISLSSLSKKFKNVVLLNKSEMNSKTYDKLFSNIKSDINDKNLLITEFEFNDLYYLHNKNDFEFRPFKDNFRVVVCENEKELLLELQRRVKEFQPQFIIGWNVINFDFNVLKGKFKEHNIEFELSSLQGESKMRVTSEFFGKDQLYFPGIIVLDGIQLLKTNYITYSSFKLSSVAKEVLGDDKVDLEESDESDFSISEKIKTIEYNWIHNPVKLIWYNYKDSILVLDIISSIKLMDLMFERSLITQTLFERLQSPIAVLDQMYLKELHKQRKVAITHYPTQGTSPIEGAYVIEPKQGFYEDIVVLDFASLYPSLMITFNIDPFKYNYELSSTDSNTSVLVKDKDTHKYIISSNGAVYEKETGILPKILRELFNLRKEAKRKKESVKSHALKITMNSFYGAMASPKSRYYNKHLAESITAFGRECLLKVKEFLEDKENLHVIYGDTDSVFVECSNLFSSKNVKSLEDKKKVMQEVESSINVYFKEWVQETFGVESFLTIEAEKVFDKFFIASKKRYVGRDEQKDLQFTGMEYVRGDWTQLAKDFQKELVELIFNGADNKKISEFIHTEILKLKEKAYDDKLVYSKKITKPLEEYTKTTPPHVKAARELKEFNGRVVEYVMTLQGPKHISLFNSQIHSYDYEHYIEKQLKGVSDEILDALEMNFDEIVQSKKQTSLNKFF
ncbi:MAG: DNA polymerase domain-containing protein [Candidatus Woesearchaeota archaeon]